ncbi:5085_t:CDS:2, partial [Ambispora gerdemannii]
WKLHFDERNIEYLISNVKHLQQAISSAVENESNELLWKGYIDLHYAGQYRTQFVMAAQNNFVYMAPNLIKDRMDELFRQCREKFGKTDLQLEEAIKYGACFLGNGRHSGIKTRSNLAHLQALYLSAYT